MTNPMQHISFATRTSQHTQLRFMMPQTYSLRWAHPLCDNDKILRLETLCCREGKKSIFVPILMLKTISPPPPHPRFFMISLNLLLYIAKQCASSAQ
jgi:hypothetical protein